MHSLGSLRCVLAALVLVGGCSEGGGEETARTIGDQFPEIDTLVLALNRVDGVGDQLGDEEYRFEVAELEVTHRWVRSSDPPVSLPPATREAMDELVEVVQGAVYRINEDCVTWAWDYVPFPPALTVRHEVEQLRVGVSDSACAKTDHSYVGPVMSCAAFEAVFTAVQSIVPDVESETCAEYW